jgi:hypothetical protein
MFLVMSMVTITSFGIVTYVHFSEDLFRNLPDPGKVEKGREHSVLEAEAEVKHSLDEAAGHYRGSAIISSDSGYSADVQGKKYRFDSGPSDSTADIHHRLLHGTRDFEEEEE